MTIEQIINWGLDRAELISLTCNETEGYYLTLIMELTTNQEIITAGKFTPGTTLKEMALVILAQVNEDLKERRDNG